MSLLNKIAIVTGASSGIGAAIAVKFTEEGATVVIVGRNEAKLKNTFDACQKRGKHPLKIIADVTKDSDAKNIISETINSFGRIDILINNAGICGYTRIANDDALSVFNKVIGTNLVSVVNLTHLAAKHVIASKGNIVNISSIAANSVMSKYSFAYGTSKAALDHFTRCVAFDLASSGVRVNTVNPGAVKTDIIENMNIPEDFRAKMWREMKKNTALDRIADPGEIADLVAFLVGDKAKSITGSNIVIDNGTSIMGKSWALDSIM